VQGPDELTVLGLRTLELWFDSLNPEFLEAAMAEVVQVRWCACERGCLRVAGWAAERASHLAGWM
jgi:hypothetical protein